MKLISLVILIETTRILSFEFEDQTIGVLNSSAVLDRSKRWIHKYSRPNPSRYVSTGCHKIDFHVNFYELGWDKWIIYPKVFNAHLCVGGCGLPKLIPQMYRKRKDNSRIGRLPKSIVTQLTNHAQIMSILEYKYPNLNQQMTKCVSTRLKPLTVIFLNEMGRIQTKQYKDMIVDECGCR